MDRPQRHRSGERARRGGAIIVVLGLLTLAFGVIAPGAAAGPASPGVLGNFEIDGDQSSAPGGTIDWADVDPTVLVDAVGPDDGLQGSSKEDEPEGFVCQSKDPTVTPGKDNLVRAYINTRVTGPADMFLDLAFIREDGGTNGDSHVNFEFNRRAVTDLCPYTSRSDGDLLITFDFPGNAALQADVQTFVWDADAPDGSDAPGKWIPFTFTGAVVAEDNLNTITDEVVGGTIAARAFGEATLDLVALAVQTGGSGCLSFGYASVKSRASSSFSAALQDIMGGPVKIDTCGKVIVHKVDDAGSPLAGASFGLWPAAAAVPPVGLDGTRPATGSIASCTSLADGTCTFDTVTPGDYKVAELTAPAGYSIDPDVIAVTVGFRATVDVAAPFVDPRHTGSVRVTKVVTDEGQPFKVDPKDLAGLTFVLEQNGVPVNTWPPPGAPAECSLDGVSLSCDIGPVPLGDYVVTEDPATLPEGVGQGPDVPVTIGEDGAIAPVTVTNPLNPISINLDKAGPDTASVGDVITYTFDATTTGEPLTITQLVEIVDLANGFDDRCDTTPLTGPDKSTTIDPDNDADDLLELDETWRWTCRHTVTMAEATDADGTLLQNKAEVTGKDRFGRVVADDDTHVVTILLYPNVNLVKVADDPSTVSAGDPVGFSITVTNAAGDGVGVASGVVVTDTLPAISGYTWEVGEVASDETTPCALDGLELSCSFGDLSPDEIASVHVVATHDGGAIDPEEACGTYPNVAAVTLTNGDEADTSDNSDTVAILCPGVNLGKVADASIVDAGDQIGFTITVSNIDDGLPPPEGVALDVVVTDDLPGDLAWVLEGSDLPPGAECEIAAGVLTCALGDLPAINEVDAPQVSIHVVAGTSEADCAVYDNTASATVGNGVDPDDVSASSTVRCPVSIDLDKTGDVLAHVGDVVAYEFTATNTGGEDLLDVELTDPECDAGTIELTDDADGDAVLAAGAWDAASTSFVGGESWTYTCQRTLSADDVVIVDGEDVALNTGSVRAEDAGGREVTDTDPHELEIITPDIEIVKTVDDDTPNVGQTVTFTYVVTNAGDTTLFDIEVVDDRLGPVGTISELAPGDSAELTMTMLVETDSPGRNTGTATGEDALGKVVTDDDLAEIQIVIGSITLPRTGTESAPVIALGVLLVVYGIALTLLGSLLGQSRRRRDLAA